MEIPVHLIIDIGNTKTKLAIFKGDHLLFKEVLDKVTVSKIKTIKKKYKFSHCIFSNVRNTKPYFIRHLEKNDHLLEMTHKLQVPIKNLYLTPETLGMDRLASVIAAHAQFKKNNVLVVDMGTCIKYDFVDKKGNYHGGNIAPGLEMRLTSMHTMTAKLPKVDRSYNENCLGRNTKEALQNGAVWGIKCEIEHFIKTLTAIWGNIVVILSGGDSNYFGEIIESKIFVLPDLVLSGLNETLKYHRSKGMI